jgi:hypothetical protein
MQCSRCGYYNSPDSTSCVKCNTPIDKKANIESSERKTKALPSEQEVKDYLSKTVSEKAGGSASNSGNKTVADFSASKTVSDFTDNEASNQRTTPSAVSETEITACPNCSYPISGLAKFCPNCSTNLDQSAKQPSPKKTKEKPVAKKERAAQKTVNFFSEEITVDEKQIVLKEIKQNGSTEIELTSKEKTITLNKESLEQEDNPAISSNAHADIINFEDEWYLVNRSSAGTTFVAATKPQKISKGDVILIGNTIYRFEG